MTSARPAVLLVAAAVLGPPLIGVVYLLAAALVGLRHLRDPLPTLGYVLFVACLAAFVVLGARRATRGGAWAAFVVLAIGSSLCAMFVVFFAQMAA